MQSEWKGRLKAAMEAARASGAYLLSHPSFHVTHKAANDYVTEADRHSEELIRSILLTKYPQDGFWGEESSESAGKAGRWIVDPIDGTTNFICDLPLYTISIAYEEEGEMVAGCVYCPRLDEMYTAVKGEGAFLNGTPIHVSEETVLRDAVIAMSFAHRSEEDGARMMAVIPALRSGVSDMRRLGSAALDLCFTACGRFQGYIELGLHLYDIAAGMLILREAGGVVSGWPKDREPVEKTGNIFSCCKTLYPALYGLISQKEQKTDAIIVLGHRLKEDNTPSDDLISRIDKTVEVWKETGAPIIMPCGGYTPGRDRTEAEVMYNMLIERGVPADVIRLESASRITKENIKNAIRLLGTEANVAMVTSDYHVPRALEDCHRAGMKAYGVGSYTPRGEYRDFCYAQERRITAEEEEKRRRGMSDDDISREVVERIRREALKKGLSIHEES